MLTPKQEEFARLVAVEMRGDHPEGLNSVTAVYRKVYSASRMGRKTQHQAACRLAAHPKVARRIAELKAEAARVAMVDNATILEELAALRDTAIAKGDLRLALDCITRRGEIAGVLPVEPRIGIRHQHHHQHAALPRASQVDISEVNSWIESYLGDDSIPVVPAVVPLPNKGG